MASGRETLRAEDLSLFTTSPDMVENKTGKLVWGWIKVKRRSSANRLTLNN